MRKIILGSGSPRRREILGSAGYDFEVITSEADENIELCKPKEMVKELSKRKAMAVADAIVKGDARGKIDREKVMSTDGFLVIGADTLVFMDGKPMGKPHSKEEEIEFLKKMSGKSHDVITGVTLVYDLNGEIKSHSFASTTVVNVAALTDEEIEWYLSTGEWTDKAGGYAIQGYFAKFITGIEGEYNNVVGFPLAAFYRELMALNIMK